MCARARRQQRAAAGAQAVPVRQRRLGGDVGVRRAPAPSATRARGVRGLPLAPRTGERMGTAPPQQLGTHPHISFVV